MPRSARPKTDGISAGRCALARDGPRVHHGHASHTSLHPTDLPDSPAGEHARGVVHLGDQHDLPARRRALEPGGVRRQRVLHGRDGHLRGANGDRRRHDRPPRLLPARHGDARDHDAAVRAALAGRGGLLGVGARLGRPRPRLHLLLRGGRGVARRRPARDRVRRQPRIGLRQGADRLGDRDADRLGGRRLHRPGDESRRAVRPPRGRARADVRTGLRRHARRRLHADPRRRRPEGDAAHLRRVDRVRLAGAGGEVDDAGVLLHGRRRLLRLLRAAALPARALRRPRGVRRRRPRRGDRRRRADRRRCGRPVDPQAVRSPHVGPARSRGCERGHAGADRR